MNHALKILVDELKNKQSFVRTLDDSQRDLLDKVELAASRKAEAEKQIGELEEAIKAISPL